MILKGKTVIVTGVGVGLGRECAARALRDGANVVLGARTEATLDAVAAELDPTGERVAAQATDITDRRRLRRRSSSTAAERFGGVDALIQVAAFEHAWGGLYDTEFDDWRAAFETNVLGALTLLRPVAAAMKAGGGGSVVLIGSQSMFQPPLPQSGLRRVQERAAVGHVLPRRRARAGQHPLQHGHPVVDVGSAGRDVRERAGQARGRSPRRRPSTTSSATSRCAA